MAELSVPVIFDFVETSVRMRTTHYREEAARFRSMARAEPLTSLRRALRTLARQYEDVAATLEAKLQGKD